MTGRLYGHVHLNGQARQLAEYRRMSTHVRQVRQGVDMQLALTAPPATRCLQFVYMAIPYFSGYRPTLVCVGPACLLQVL